jgi:hypothetical protein
LTVFAILTGHHDAKTVDCLNEETNVINLDEGAVDVCRTPLVRDSA